MATQKEQAQIDVIINGQKAGATINDMEKAIKLLNTQIKSLQPGTEAFIKKTEELQKVSAKLKDVKQSVTGVSSETKNMISEMAKMGPAGGIINMLTGGFQSLTGGISIAVKGFMTLTGAIAGLGIGLLLIAFAALITYIKGSEEGGDRLAKIMTVVQAIFGQVVKVVSAVGGALFDAGEAIFDFIAGTEEAKKATDDYSKSVTQLASEVADLQDHIGALTIDIDLQNDKLQTGIESNMKALKNRNTSLEESKKIIKEIADAEQQKLKNSTELTTQQLAVEKKLFLAATEQTQAKGALFDKFINGQITGEELLNKAKGTFKEEDLKRIAEILKQKEAAIREEANLGEKLNNLEDAAVAKEKARQDKLEEERKRRIDKKQKQIEDDAKREEAIQKNIFKLQQDALTDSIEDKKKKLQAQAEEEIKLLQGNEEQKATQRLLIEQRLTNDISKIDDAARAEKKKKEEEFEAFPFERKA